MIVKIPLSLKKVRLGFQQFNKAQMSHRRTTNAPPTHHRRILYVISLNSGQRVGRQSTRRPTRWWDRILKFYRALYRKSSCQPDAVKCIALACVVLHNVYIDMSDSLPSQLDLTEHPAQHGRRSRKEVRELLMMRNCTMKKDKSHHAEEIRKALLDKFWEEKEEQ